MAAVAALEAVLSSGAHECIRDIAGFREHNVIDVNEFYQGGTRINHFAALAQDPNSRVRARLAVLLGGVLQVHPHRHDYETLLMPYLFTLVADSRSEVS